MAQPKKGYDKLLGQTQKQKFTNTSVADVCVCLTTRNMCKTETGHVGEMTGKLRKGRHKQKPLDAQNICNSIYNRGTVSSSPRTSTGSHPLFRFATKVSLVLYGGLMQHLVGSLVWHVTSSTAISIFATFYYFITNTQGASAVLDVTTATLSSSALHSALTTPLSTTNLSFSPASQDYTNHNGHSISTNNNYSNILLDLNYNINSTEITFLNRVSSLATNKVSGISFDNNNNSRSNGDYNNVIKVSYNNNVIGFNESMDEMPDEDASEYIFDRTDVRIIFITLYSMVFCCCFFGNLLVILVVTLSRRLRSITNFFLANLALADFCVGLFCVMQNLSIYLIDSWVFGEFLCRMYQFVHSLSYTASIFILVVICMERYFAIVHPITCKQILTAARLKMAILSVWITSALYSTPKFVFSKTIKNVHTQSGREEEICVLDRKMYNSKILDMINFGLLYVVPLLVMSILYSKIAVALWRSSRGLQHHLTQQENGMGMHNSNYHHHQHHNHNHNNHHHMHNHHQQLSQQQQQQQQQHLTAPLGTSNSVNSSVASCSVLARKQSCKYDAKRGVNISESQVSLDADRPVVSTCRKTSFYQHSHNHLTHQQQQTPPPASTNHQRSHSQHQGVHGSQRISHISHSSNNVLRARRGVVRMLIIFVLTFALCNLPYHARKMWQYWSRSYRGDSNFNALLTPLTFLVTYFNSGINPLLYAFLSRNFRKGMKELLMCSWRKSKTKSSQNSSMHHKRMALQTHSLPTDTTHIGNDQL